MIDHWRRNPAQRIVSIDDDRHDEALVASLEDPSPAGNPLRCAAALQEAGVLVAALDTLAPAQRDAFLLHVEGGLPVAEIAALNARAGRVPSEPTGLCVPAAWPLHSGEPT